MVSKALSVGQIVEATSEWSDFSAMIHDGELGIVTDEAHYDANGQPFWMIHWEGGEISSNDHGPTFKLVNPARVIESLHMESVRLADLNRRMTETINRYDAWRQMPPLAKQLVEASAKVKGLADLCGRLAASKDPKLRAKLDRLLGKPKEEAQHA